MEFHGLPRRTLQSLCKKNGIPANLTNVAMADALHSLQTVEGVDETQEENQTPHKSPPPLRPPNPPRSCRRSSIISLIKQTNPSRKKRTFIVKDEDGDKELRPGSLLAFPASSKRRRDGRTLIPCEQKEILKSMRSYKVGEGEGMSGQRDEHHVTDEMPVRRKSCRYKDVDDIMKVCEGDCRLNEAAVVVSSPEETLGQGNGDREEGLKNEVFVYEEMPVRGKTSGDKNGMSRDCLGEAVLVSTYPGPAEEQGSRNAVFASEEMLVRGDGTEDQDDAEMVADEKGEETIGGEHFCGQSKPTLASQDHLEEAVLVPSSTERVKEHSLKNGNFSFEEMLVRGGGRDWDLNEAGTMPGYPEVVEEQGFKNMDLASEEGNGDENAEVMEDEKEGEDTNGESFCRGNNLTQASGDCQLNEAVRMLNSQESVSVIKSHEFEPLCGASLGGSGSDEQEQGLMDGLQLVLREEAEGLGLKNACFASEGAYVTGATSEDKEGEETTISRGTSGSENHVCKNQLPPPSAGENGEVAGYTVNVADEMCLTSERCEDKDDKVMKYCEGEETNVESFCGQSNLTWACGDCQLNEAVLTPSSQESVEDQGPENALFASEEVHVRGETDEEEDAEMLKYKTEEEERTSSRGIHIGSGNLESHVVKNLISPSDSEANGESSCQQGKPGSRDCPSNAVVVLRDQEHGPSPDQSLGPLIPCGREDRSTNGLEEQVLKGKMEKQGQQEGGLQNMLTETCEMTVRTKENEGMGDQKRSSEGIQVEIQVNVNVYTTSNRIIPLDLKGNQEQNSVVPDYEKAANSINPIRAIQDLHQKSPTTSETLDSSHGLDIIKNEDHFRSKSIVTSMFIEKEVAKSSSPHVLQIGLQLSSNTLEPSDAPSTYGATTGGEKLLSPENGGTIANPVVVLNSISQPPAFYSETISKEQEGETRESVEGTDLAKDNTEVKSVGGAKAEENLSENAGLGGLSLRKLRSLYKENKKTSQSEMANEVKAETGGGETTMKDELEEDSAEKARMNNLSLRKLKLMYKHKVANEQHN